MVFENALEIREEVFSESRCIDDPNVCIQHFQQITILGGIIDVKVNPVHYLIKFLMELRAHSVPPRLISVGEALCPQSRPALTPPHTALSRPAATAHRGPSPSWYFPIP